MWPWIGGLVAVLAAGGAGAVWWLRRSVVQVTIDGASMLPSFADGDRVLVRRAGPGGTVRTGEVVAVAPHRVESAAPVPDGDVVATGGPVWIIKRVAAAPGEPIPPDLGQLSTQAGELVPDGFAVLLGDNPDHSFDSRQEGLVNLDRLRGRIIRESQ